MKTLLQRLPVSVFLFLAMITAAPSRVVAEDTSGTSSWWKQENLAAWCVVPFDVKKRGPEERAAMLERLGFTKFAYDWRAEHVSTFAQEMAAMRAHHIEIIAWWFPTKMNDDAPTILRVLHEENIRPQLCVAGKGEPVHSASEPKVRVAEEAARFRPIAEAAAEPGCNVGLYHHSGWFGDPENEVAIMNVFKPEGFANLGAVYNFHHGHDDIDRSPGCGPNSLRTFSPF